MRYLGCLYDCVLTGRPRCSQIWEHPQTEARKLAQGRPPTANQRKKEQRVLTIRGPCSNFLESTVHDAGLSDDGPLAEEEVR